MATFTTILVLALASNPARAEDCFGYDDCEPPTVSRESAAVANALAVFPDDEQSDWRVTRVACYDASVMEDAIGGCSVYMSHPTAWGGKPARFLVVSTDEGAGRVYVRPRGERRWSLLAS